MIYLPPYGLESSINFMLKVDPRTYQVSKIPLEVDSSFKKWQFGTVVDNQIIFLPYNESRILIINTDNDAVSYVTVPFVSEGKYISAQLHNQTVVALPYGENETFDYAISFDTTNKTASYKKIECDINDQKKWHTSQYLNNKVHALPRGERWAAPYFPYRIELDCDTLEYYLEDLSSLWLQYDRQEMTNKKYTTLAKANKKLYAPPYSENPNFDIMMTFSDAGWSCQHTEIQATSRKYYSHVVSTNGKIYFPPAGHDEEWSQMLIVDSNDDSWYTLDLGIGKESKKYFGGKENSQGKLFFMPRGGCACMPVDTWKEYGDLTEVLVVDTRDDSFYTIDVSNYFLDNTTIEKYNSCIIIDDVIFAFPYGESESFQTVLVFDTIQERVIKTLDLNDI